MQAHTVPGLQGRLGHSGSGRRRSVGKPVEASTAREAIEKREPQAFGRYRVTLVESEKSGVLFRVESTPGDATVRQVDAFP